jgi:choline dehydrogenase-like flavoprotein
VIGGSGAVNGTTFLRGIPDDYDAGGSDQWRWPEVMRTFVDLETDEDVDADYHGKAGPIPISRHARSEWGRVDIAFYETALAFGFAARDDMNGPDRDGIGRFPRNMADGRRVDTAVAYLDPVRTRPNLTVIGRARVRRILWDGTRVVGVEYERDGQATRLEVGQVILAAGAIESPHLLFVSGIGPADDLRSYGIPVVADLAGVGKNLQDHPTHLLPVTPAANVVQPDAITAPLGIHYTAADSPYEGDMHLVLASTPPSPLTSASLTFGCTLNREVSVGRLHFASGDPSDRPRLEFGYLQHPADRRRARDGLRIAISMMKLPPLSRLIESVEGPAADVLESDRSFDEWLCANVHTAYHTVGTCKLGPASDGLAVVDDHCRVYGVEGVWVADLSIAPVVPRANTYGTAVMIGERTAELIGEQLC